MGVTTVHRQYAARETDWQKCRDAFDGSDAVKARGETHLPKLGGQSDDDYEAYKERALFYNTTARTVQGWLGCVFRKDPVVNAPDQMLPQLYDVTQTGIPIQAFAKTVLQEVLLTGRYGILVDMPTEETPERRPYLVPYKAEQIVNWRTERRQGDVIVSMVVLKEAIEEMDPVDPFEPKVVDQYRVLTLEGPALDTYAVRIWRQTKQSDQESWAPVEEYFPKLKGVPFDFIPFCFVGANTIQCDVERSPSSDLVDVNLSHYRSSADLEHGRHFTALPTVWVAGFESDTELKIGSQTAWVTERTDAKAGILEFTGQGLGALEKALTQKEAMMAALGARLLEDPKRAAEAAEAIRLRLGGEQVALKTIANTLSQALTIVLGWYADWAGFNSDEVSVELNTEFFEHQMDPSMLRELVTTWQGGAIAASTMFYNLQRGGLTRPDVTFEEEQAEIAAGMPPPSQSGEGQ